MGERTGESAHNAVPAPPSSSITASLSLAARVEGSELLALASECFCPSIMQMEGGREDGGEEEIEQ